MTKKERFKKVFPILREKFGNPKAALEFETPYQLMVAVILSAQCTDVRVNIVTKELFKVVKEPEDIRQMDLETLEKYIKSTGFYRNKAKNIKLNAEMMLEKYDDKIPKELEKLVELIERELMKFVPKKDWFVYSHYMILHGRDKCIARSPKCDICEIQNYCKYNLDNLRKE